MDTQPEAEAVGTVGRITELQERTRRVVRSNWMLPTLWAVLCFGALVWSVLLTGAYASVFDSSSNPFVDTDVDNLVTVYKRLIGYWGWALPVGVVGSYVLYCRATLKPLPPRLRLLHAPLLVATVLVAWIAFLTLEDVLYPLHGPANWFPWIAMTTLVLAWLNRVWLLVAVSACLLAFSAYWYLFATPTIGFPQVVFMSAYALTAVALRVQASRP